MIVIQNEQPWFVDVDDTLILWDVKIDNCIEITCPYSGESHTVAAHIPNITLLKEKYARGCHITVWSKGGYKWAEAVVKALRLEHLVHTVMSKPEGLLDDKDPSEWLPKVTYLPRNLKWKC